MLLKLLNVELKQCRGEYPYANIDLLERSLVMEVLNLILFGCVFYLALIGIPSMCEKKGH